MQLADSIRKARQIQNKLSHPSCAAVIVAAGSSARMGGTDKILAELGGLPVLSRTLRVFDDHDMVDTIIVVAREDQLPKISRVCSPYHKVRIVVPGGQSRQESVMNGLEAVPEGTELVAVHDGARPLVSPEVITKAILKAAKFGAAAPAIPVKDTIKVSKSGGVDETPDRKTLFAVQTPQVFDCASYGGAAKREGKRHLAHGRLLGGRGAGHDGASHGRLRRKYQNHDAAGPGNCGADFKTEGKGLRIGHGYDVHRLVSDRKLILGGVDIPFEKGLSGHSDADVLVHAIMDALLGAAALGDIGKLFPDTDDAYLDADSMELLKSVREVLRAHDWKLGNLDATVLAQRPKLAPYIDTMRSKIADALQTDIENVSVKATTEEKLGFTGRGEGIAAHAVCLIERV